MACRQHKVSEAARRSSPVEVFKGHSDVDNLQQSQGNPLQRPDTTTHIQNLPANVAAIPVTEAFTEYKGSLKPSCLQ